MHARHVYFGTAVVSLSAVCLAVFLQEAWQLDACTWCILQRYLYLGLSAFSLLCAFTTGRRPGQAVLPTMTSLAGLAAAAWNVWVIYVPSVTCGRDKLAAVVNNLPPAQIWPTVFEANGLCSESPVVLAGVPFPVLSFVTFAVLLGAVIFAHGMSRSEGAVAK
jgi:disulfide bond formation protein DsbB